MILYEVWSLYDNVIYSCMKILLRYDKYVYCMFVIFSDDFIGKGEIVDKEIEFFVC